VAQRLQEGLWAATTDLPHEPNESETEILPRAQGLQQPRQRLETGPCWPLLTDVEGFLPNLRLQSGVTSKSCSGGRLPSRSVAQPMPHAARRACSTHYVADETALSPLFAPITVLSFVHVLPVFKYGQFLIAHTEE